MRGSGPDAIARSRGAHLLAGRCANSDGRGRAGYALPSRPRSPASPAGRRGAMRAVGRGLATWRRMIARSIFAKQRREPARGRGHSMGGSWAMLSPVAIPISCRGCMVVDMMPFDGGLVRRSRPRLRIAIRPMAEQMRALDGWRSGRGASCAGSSGRSPRWSGTESLRAEADRRRPWRATRRSPRRSMYDLHRRPIFALDVARIRVPLDRALGAAATCPSPWKTGLPLCAVLMRERRRLSSGRIARFLSLHHVRPARSVRSANCARF